MISFGLVHRVLLKLPPSFNIHVLFLKLGTHRAGEQPLSQTNILLIPQLDVKQNQMSWAQYYALQYYVYYMCVQQKLCLHLLGGGERLLVTGGKKIT